MSQLNSMAIPMEGKYSKSELLELKNKMNAKALAKRRSKTALRLAANIIFAILVLLPLLYAVSIALMPSNELFTTDLNLFPKHPTLQNFKEAFTTVPLLRFILNSFIMQDVLPSDRSFPVPLPHLHFPSWNLREKESFLQLLWQP